MKKALSQDMRELALRKIEEGEKQKAIASELGVSERTIYNWKIIKERYNRTKPIGYDRNKGKKLKNRQVQDDEKFIKFVEENPFKTQEEMAKLWNKMYDDKVTKYGIRTAMLANKLTFKKKLQITKKHVH